MIITNPGEKRAVMDALAIMAMKHDDRPDECATIAVKIILGAELSNPDKWLIVDALTHMANDLDFEADKATLEDRPEVAGAIYVASSAYRKGIAIWRRHALNIEEPVN